VEAIEDAAVGEADVVMEGAMDGIAARSRVLHGLRSRALLQPPLFVPPNRRERSNLVRRWDTSQYCFLENRFPNTGD
jgi:hypothetical protein